MIRSRLLPMALVAFSLSLGVVACGGSNEEALQLTPEATAGKQYFDRSCRGCHSVNGAVGSGPTMKALAGSQVELEDGTTVTADDAYLTTAILNPGDDIVKGFNQSMASAYPPGSISEEEAAQLVAYIKALK